MLLATLKSLVARKVRLAMSAFAIVLGVAFVAGSYMFTDTLDRTFEELFSDLNGDVVVRPEGAAGLSSLVGNAAVSNDGRTVPATLVDELAALDGALRADGVVENRSVFVVGTGGRVVSGGGAPGIGANWSDAPNTTGEAPLKIAEGRPPTADGEVVVDARTAEMGGYALGDTVRLITSAEQATVDATLVGTATFGESANLAGATLALFETATAQRLLLDGADAFTTITIAARDGITQDELRADVAAILPDELEARTGTETSNETSDGLRDALGFFTTFLLVFAAVALFVGTFLILNTFSILVAQRSQEMALYRALGATRRQMTRSVLLEAFVVGVLGATVGLVLGLGVAQLLKFVFSAFGLDLGPGGLVLAPRTVGIAYLVGIVVTMAAAYIPARRAARVAPVAAMREDIALPQAPRSLHAGLGGALAAAGAGALAGGLFLETSWAAELVGVGISGVFLGVALLAPILAGPVVRVIAAGYPRLLGTVGHLARENALRNPRRTAATASALMIGLALVSAMAVIGESTNKSIDVALEDDLSADFVISNAVAQPFSPSVAADAAVLDGVADVAQVRWQAGQVAGSDANVAALDTAAFARAVRVDVTEGALDLGDDGVLVGTELADREGLGLGDALVVTLPAGNRQLRVAGVFVDNPVIGSEVVIPLDMLSSGGVTPADSFVYVVAEPDADPARVLAELEQLTAQLPTVTVKDQEAFKEEQRAPVNRLLSLVYALLGLAVLIAVLGIVNTLALSVMERTREVGLLRAVGMSRRQLRTMVRWESVAIAVLGAVLGIVLGVVFGVALQSALSGEGLEVLAIPWPRLAAFVVLAALVGILAAVWPARRAARLDVLRAITTE
ncbi:MAG: ABC transporter permease [Jiangellaceae bacterium]